MTDKKTDEPEVDLTDTPEDPPLQPVETPISGRAAVLKEAAEIHRKQMEEGSNLQFDVMDDNTGVISPPTVPETPPVEPAQLTVSPDAPAAEPAPAAPEPFDPTKEYDIVVEGQTIKVPGSRIIEMGKATLQKETAADYKLTLASNLLEEANRRIAAAGAPPVKDATPPAPTPDPEQATKEALELAKAIQFGTQEQAAEAIRKLAARTGQPGITGEQVMGFMQQHMPAIIRDNMQFETALAWAQDEYKDLLQNDYLKRMFFAEEDRRRQMPDSAKLPYKDLYRAIGEDLRKAFGVQKAVPPSPTKPAPAPTLPAKQAVKAAAPTVPPTAAARLSDAPAPQRPKSVEEIVAATRAARKQPPLN